jgi:deoxyribonuclease V
MDVADLHPWPTDTASALALQRELAQCVDDTTPLPSFDLVAGADISYNRHDPTLYAAVVVWRPADGTIVATADVVAQAQFPYVPGFLSFREAPAVLEAFRQLHERPDVVLCDGQGRAHPRRFGLACHLGLWLGMPTIGCGKSRLCGTFEEPGPARGDSSPLIDREEIIGRVLRTRDRVRPLYVSAGHRIDLASALAVVLACGRRYRQPEPTRLAHERVNALRRAAGEAP